jgi:hypothetical protein
MLRLQPLDKPNIPEDHGRYSKCQYILTDGTCCPCKWTGRPLESAAAAGPIEKCVCAEEHPTEPEHQESSSEILSGTYIAASAPSTAGVFSTAIPSDGSVFDESLFDESLFDEHLELPPFVPLGYIPGYTEAFLAAPPELKCSNHPNSKYARYICSNPTCNYRLCIDCEAKEVGKDTTFNGQRGVFCPRCSAYMNEIDHPKRPLSDENGDRYLKYLKYKQKYLNLKKKLRM